MKIGSQISLYSRKTPNKLSIVEVDTGRSITYSELCKSVSVLIQEVVKKKRVLLALPSGIENSIVWLAGLAGGSYLIPISSEVTNDEFENYVNTTSPDVVITDREFPFPKKFKHLTKRDVENIAKSKKGADIEEIIGYLYLTTSGSTGIPKGIELSSNSIEYTAEQIIKLHSLSSEDRGLTSLPFHHINAPVVSLLSTILSGGTLLVASKFSLSRFWILVEKYDPTWISMVPTILALLLDTAKPDFLDNKSIRFVRTASAPLPKANLESFEEKFGIPVIETYGLTEAASTIAGNPLPPLVHKAGSVGFPIGVDIKIAKIKSSKIIFLPFGKVGEICVRGPNIIQSYVKNENSRSFEDGWFRTGDMGYFDEEGYLYITGRIRDVIIRGGENISPREIEEVIYQLPYIGEVCVVGQADKIYGEKVVAFIVLRDENILDVKEEILIHLNQKLSRFKIPSEIYILEKLPRGKTGKIDKNTLRNYPSII